MYEIACSPGSRREPDTIAAIVSSTWCLVFSATAGGSGFLRRLRDVGASRCITGETLTAG